MNLSKLKDKTKTAQAPITKPQHLKHSSKFISLLIVLVSLVIIIAVTIGTARRIVFEHEQAVNRRIQLNANIAISIEQQIINVLQKAEQVAAFTGYVYAHNHDGLEIEEWIQHDLLLDKNLFSIGVINSDGILAINSGITATRSDYKDASFFQKLENNRYQGLLIERPIFYEPEQKWLLPLYKRIENDNGGFAGIVMLTIGPQELGGFFKNMNMSTAFVELANPQGIVYSRVLGDRLVLDNKVENYSWNSRLLRNNSGTYIDNGNNIDELNRVVAFRKMAGYELFITVGTSYQNAVAMAESRKDSHIFTGIVINLLVIIIAVSLIYLLRRQDKAVFMTQANEALFRATFHHAGLGIARISPSGQILETNTKFQRMLGYSSDELFNKNIIDLLSEQDRAGAEQFINDRLTEYFLGMPPEIERVYIHKTGKKIWVHEALSVVRKSNGVADFLVSAIQDITARKNLEKELSYAASHDLLTELPNRLLLQRGLAQAIALAENQSIKVAVVFLDLNGFKNINDTYGHSIGDELLKIVAARLKNTLRAKSGDIVSRYGGDEFCLVLVNLKNTDDCEKIAYKLADVLSQPFELGVGVTVSITTSIGAAFYPDDSQDIDELITQADFAMYYAKNNGFTYSCWQDAMHPKNQLKAVD